MDWNRIGEVALACFSQGWSFIAVALGVYYWMESLKRLADRKGWRAEHPDESSWFDATLPSQPVAWGAIFMQIPFPVWEAIDGIDKADGRIAEACARFAYGCLAGALSGQIFETVQAAARFARKRAGIAEDGRKTPIVETPKMVPSSVVSHVVPANDPMPTSETLLDASERVTEPEEETKP